MKKKLLLLLTAVLLTGMLTGCYHLFPGDILLQTADRVCDAYRSNPLENRVLLNERQKELLREVGLPDHYDALNSIQKDAIVKIENCTCYMEEKYPDDRGKFSYSGFFGDQVTLKVQDSEPEFHVIVDIYSENGKVKYKDNYLEYLVLEPYTAELKAFLSAYLDPADFIIFPYVEEVKEEGDTLVSRVLSFPTIVLNHVDEEEIEEIGMAYVKWLKEEHHKEFGVIHFVSYSEEYYSMFNELNYYDVGSPWMMNEDSYLTVRFSGNEQPEFTWREQ